MPDHLDVFGRVPENSTELIRDEFANSQVTEKTRGRVLRIQWTVCYASNRMFPDCVRKLQATGNTGSSLLERNLCSQLQTAVPVGMDEVEIRTAIVLLFSVHWDSGWSRHLERYDKGVIP